MTESARRDPKNGPVRRRKGAVALILSLLLPGLGQLYNGQPRKALVFFLASVFVPAILFLLIARSLSVAALGTVLLSGLVVQFVAAIDGWCNARAIGYDFRPAWFNLLPIYLAFYLICGPLLSGIESHFIREHLVEAFKLPSSSMEPTLLRGDHILVDKRGVNFARGDLVIFEFPPDQGKAHPRDFIKRIVGLPGDQIEIRDKQLLVNGQPMEEPYAVHHDTETVPAVASPRDFFGPVEVLQGSYFMLGDNRDYSYDSRFWGTVTKGKIKGRVLNIYWSWDGQEHRVRWDRIGREISVLKPQNG